jgi:hypothetical protein
MPPRRPSPPPERLTARDVVQIVFGFLMVPIGAVILYRTATTIRSFTGIAIGAAFLAFGVYRLATAFIRYRMLLRMRARR